MLFNSINFALFLPVVFFLYWFATRRNLKIQNILLLVASYFFYASWNYKFMFLLIFSTLLDYYTGIKIYEANTRKFKLFWLWLSISINLGFLGVFKYFNFFAESFAQALSLLGFHADFITLYVILPVGISFYTFHGLSYVFDLYNNKIKPERNFINYGVFVSFFIAWGFLNALFIMPSVIFKTNRTNLEIVAKGKYFPGIKDFVSIVITFGLTLLAWIFFRANDLSHAFNYLGEIFSASFITIPDFKGVENIWPLVILVAVFIIIEWFGREEQYAIAGLGLTWKKPLRWAFYYSIVMVIFLFAGKEQQFIYFQF